MPDDLSAAFTTLSALPPEIEIATNIVVRDCLVDAGYDVPFTAAWSPVPNDTFAGIGGVLISEEIAITYGYTSTFRDDYANSFEVYGRTLSASEAEAFEVAQFGDWDGDTESYDAGGGMIISTPSSGCMASAAIAIFGSVAKSLEVGGFGNEVIMEVATYANEQSGLMNELVPRYVECMAEQGYEVDGLRARYLAEELFGHYRAYGEPPGRDEQQLAAADFACQDEQNLRGELQSLFEENAGAWLVANEARLLALRETVASAVENANAIING